LSHLLKNRHTVVETQPRSAPRAVPENTQGPCASDNPIS
jgi:hypothetical protein